MNCDSMMSIVWSPLTGKLEEGLPLKEQSLSLAQTLSKTRGGRRGSGNIIMGSLIFCICCLLNTCNLCLFIFSFYRKLTVGLNFVSVTLSSFLREGSQIVQLRILQNLHLFLQLESELGGPSLQESQGHCPFFQCAYQTSRDDKR